MDSFVEIAETTPVGTDRGKVLDENIRAFKSATASCFKAISGYPTLEALVTRTWTTGGRPTDGLKEGITGWNTTDKAWDRYNGSAWEQLGAGRADTWTVAGRPTAPFTGQFGYNTELAVIERWSGTAWERISGKPRGMIDIWSGSVANIPAGWVLCDGTTRTHPEGGNVAPPDLRNRFIVGAGQDGGYHTPGSGGAGSGYYAPGAAGGEDMHTLTISEMPSHNHYVWGGVEGGDGGITSRNTGSSYAQQSSYTGGSGSHENRPPYYAICYLYKL